MLSRHDFTRKIPFMPKRMGRGAVRTPGTVVRKPVLTHASGTRVSWGGHCEWRAAEVSVKFRQVG